MSPAKGGQTARSPRRTRAAKSKPSAARGGDSADGYEGVNWQLYALARVGNVRTAVGAGLVGYGMWMYVVKSHMPETADPDSLTGAVLQ